MRLTSQTEGALLSHRTDPKGGGDGKGLSGRKDFWVNKKNGGVHLSRGNYIPQAREGGNRLNQPTTKTEKDSIMEFGAGGFICLEAQMVLQLTDKGAQRGKGY